MAHLTENIVGFLSFFSPPFLTFFVWRNFLKPAANQQPTWKVWLDWTAVVCTSGFFLVCLVAAVVIPQDVQKDNWASVAIWRSFTGNVVRIAPLFLFLAILGRNKTRLFSVLLIIAVVLDCVAVDMMA
jgi:hypothetical protein